MESTSGLYAEFQTRVDTSAAGFQGLRPCYASCSSRLEGACCALPSMPWRHAGGGSVTLSRRNVSEHSDNALPAPSGVFQFQGVLWGYEGRCSALFENCALRCNVLRVRSPALCPQHSASRWRCARTLPASSTRTPRSVARASARATRSAWTFASRSAPGDLAW